MFCTANRRVVLNFGILALISTFKKTFGSGKVTVQLADFRNSQSRVYDGGCCDNVNWCINECDNYFRLCFAKTSSADKCSLWSGWTTVLGDDSFSFPKAGGSLGNGIMNPLTFSFTRWEPILFSVEVWDEDSGSANDLVDRYSLSIQTTPSPTRALTAARRHKMSGKGYSYLNVDVKVFCDANYFIPDCSTYCAPRNDDSGHYTCDFTRGQKVCLSGWYGSNCLTYCMPRNDSLGHYGCDSNGQIKCLNNWYGKDCVLYCKPSNGHLGHYSCDVNGTKKCLSGWYGKDCLTYCVSRNDSLGHYTCDVKGRRKCLKYWYGLHCLVYCKPRNDSFGHYTCNSTGNIVCLEGWRWQKCTESELAGGSSTMTSTTGLQHEMSLSRIFSQPSTSSREIPSTLDRGTGFQNQTSTTHVFSQPSASSLTTIATTFMPTTFATSLHAKDKEPAVKITMTTRVTTSSTLDSKLVQVTSQSQAFRPKASGQTLVPTPSVGLVHTKDKELSVKPTKTTSSTINSTLGQVLSQSQASGPKTNGRTLMPTPSVESAHTKDKELTTKSTMVTREMTPSTLDSILGQVTFKTQNSVPSTSVPTLVQTPSTKSTYSNEKELTVQSSKTTRVMMTPSTLHSVIGQFLIQTRASSPKAGEHTLVSTPAIKSIYSNDKEFEVTVQVTEATRASIPSTVMLKSTPSAIPLCTQGDDEVTADPTFKPEETSGILVISVEFQEKADHELVIPRVISRIKTVLAKQLNKVCIQEMEACNLTAEDKHSVWFCPRDVNVQIDDVAEKGVSLKIASSLPSPLNGMVSPQTLREIVNRSKEYLESETQANFTWMQVDELTTPRTLIYGKPDQLTRLSVRQKKNPLPYILGIAGTGLILVVVLFVVRAKVAKRNMIHPCTGDDDLPLSPSLNSQYEADTVVLLTRAKEKYVCKGKESTRLNMDCGFDVPEAIEEIYL